MDRRLSLRSIASAVLLSASLAVVQLCTTADSHTGDAPAAAKAANEAARPLASASASADELASRVLSGLASRDQKALADLVVTKDEFCTWVYPELPSSKVPNVSCDFVWQTAMMNHEGGFREVLGAHNGKRYTLVSLRFEKGVQDYPSYRVYREPVVTVKDEASKTHEYRLFGPILEMDGQFKLFGYMVH